jgi:hypothetical protein
VTPRVTTPLISGPLLATENDLLILMDGKRMFIMNKACKDREPTDKEMITATLGDDNLYHVDDMTKFITSTQANYICRCDGKSILNRMIIPTTQAESIKDEHNNNNNKIFLIYKIYITQLYLLSGN